MRYEIISRGSLTISNMIEYSEIISSIVSSELQKTLLPLRVLFLVISLGFLGFLIFFLFRTKWLKFLIINDLIEFFTLKMKGAKKIAKTWRKIQKKISKGREDDYKWAIVKADDLLGKALQRLVLLYQSQTFEERLAWLTEATFPNIKELQQAHEIRKKIEQYPGFTLDLDQGKKILTAYQQAFRELEIIQ